MSMFRKLALGAVLVGLVAVLRKQAPDLARYFKMRQMGGEGLVHELGLCEGILEAVERRAAGRRVTRVRVRVGAQHRVVSSAFDQSVALVSQGTVADGAAVDLVVVPVSVTLPASSRSEVGSPRANVWR